MLKRFTIIVLLQFYRHLEVDEFAKKSRLALKLEQVYMCFDSEV